MYKVMHYNGNPGVFDTVEEAFAELKSRLYVTDKIEDVKKALDTVGVYNGCYGFNVSAIYAPNFQQKAIKKLDADLK